MLYFSNKVAIVGGGYAPVIPHTEGEVTCDKLLGIKYCTKTTRADTHGKIDAPYYPLNGETR